MPISPFGNGPNFPPSRGMSSPGFFEQWFSQDAEAWDIAARSSLVRGSAATPLHVEGERNEVLLNPPLEVMLQAVVTLGERVPEGRIVQAVSIPWLAFLRHIKRNPAEMYEIDWRRWEEIIAAAYHDAGYSVILTPRSGDKGRDVIATLEGVVSVRYFDQVKAYAPGNPVTLDDVSNMLGLLSREPNVSKGIITTTSDFAPGVYTDEGVSRFRPYRLDLRPRDELLKWLAECAQEGWVAHSFRSLSRLSV